MNLFDDDYVELSNLNRQIIYDSSDVGAKNFSRLRKEAT